MRLFGTDDPPYRAIAEDAVVWGFWLTMIFLFLLLATLPVYPYSRRWGYYPSGAAVVALIVVLFMIWLGYLAFAWPWSVAEPR